MRTLQEFLPPGIEIEKELPDVITRPAPSQLFRVRDGRACSEAPVVRFLRLIDPSELQKINWISWGRSRLQLLLSAPLPAVLTPLEVGWTPDGSIYVLEHEWKQTLSGKWPLTSARRRSAELLEQLLTGLTALHDVGIAHGDVRPDNIALLPVGPDGKTTSAWLANTWLGGLTFLTGGAYVASDMTQYFPPEWNGRAQAPTPSADLYALGVVAHKLACGRESLPPRSSELVPSIRRCQKMSWHGLMGDDLDGFVHLLLQDSGTRPKNGREALRRIQRWRRWVTWRRPLLMALTILILLTIGLIWRGQALAGATRQNQDLRSKAASAVGEKTSLEAKIIELNRMIRQNDKQFSAKDNELISLKEELRQCQGDPPPNQEPAQKAWTAASQEAKGDYVPEIFNKHRAQIPDKNKQGSLPLFRGWEKIILERRGRAAVWKDHAPDVKERWSQLLSSPWDEARVSAFDHRLDALDSAAKVWEKWALNDHLKFSDLRNQTESESEEVRRILNTWLNETESRRDWSLRLISAKAPDGYGTYRGICIYGDEWAEDWHDWSQPTLHQYQNRSLQFRWTAGKPIIIRMFTYRTISIEGFRQVAMSFDFKGPLAIWRVQEYKRVASMKGFEIEFEINDCPGPPRSILATSVGHFKEILK